MRLVVTVSLAVALSVGAVQGGLPQSLTSALTTAPATRVDPGAAPAAAGRPAWSTDRLPAPFDAWDVDVAPDAEDPRALMLQFNSPLLGRRVQNLVWLPADSRSPLPVLYFLHGTLRMATAPGAPGLFDDIEGAGVNVPYPLGPSTGRAPVAFVGSTMDRSRYAVVAPDIGPEPWCEHCSWVDGVGGVGVPAESHLHTELMPLVEELFGARRDRGGRAIVGRSMGGGGAFIQAFRHPDRFAFAGALSGYIDLVYDPVLGPGLWAGYTRGQGYASPLQDEIGTRAINPVDLAAGLVGVDIELVLTLGEGCVTMAGQGNCVDHPVTESFPTGAGQEILLRASADRWAPHLTQLGLALWYHRREGIHGPINAEEYVAEMLPRLNRLFARPVATPERFSYKSVDSRFSIWGYDVEVRRPNREFLHLLGARTDGRELLLAGTGEADVITPAAFEPGRRYLVTVRQDTAGDTTLTVRADAAGRLAFTVPLGPSRAHDERLALVESGAFDFPKTRVTVEEQ